MTSPEEVKAQYGFVAALAQAVPEIGSLMQQAVSEKWTPSRFQMAVANTNWWKTTPPNTRQWVTQQYSDPAGASASLKDGGAQMSTLAGKLGFLSDSFNAKQASDAWLYSKLHGFDESQTRAYVVAQAAPKAGGHTMGGEFGKWQTDAQQMAQAYGQTADQYLGNYNQAWAGGTGDLAGLQQKLVNYAAAKYAPFADRIRAGETVKDIAQPYLDTYAQTLELSPQSVKLDDPIVQKWLQGQSEAGKPPVAAPVWQAAQELRKDPRWQYTDNAHRAAASVATTIGRAFGMIG